MEDAYLVDEHIWTEINNRELSQLTLKSLLARYITIIVEFTLLMVGYKKSISFCNIKPLNIYIAFLQNVY